MKNSLVVGIGGGTGSGKTALCDLLRRMSAAAGVAIIDQDSYYLDRSGLTEEQKGSFNYDHPSAFDHDLLLNHLEQLLSGLPVGKPCYCFGTHTRSSQTDIVRPAPVILVEGIFGLWDARLRSHMDLKIYVDAEAGLRFTRRLRRDVLERGRTLDSVVKQYFESVRPMHEAYVEPTKAYADVVIDNSRSIEDLATVVESLAKRLTNKPSNFEATGIGGEATFSSRIQ